MSRVEIGNLSISHAVSTFHINFLFLIAGHHLYTIGQRARIGGCLRPYFVVAKNSTDNTVTVAEGPTHPALYTHCFTTSQPHWITCTPHDIVQKLHDVSDKSHDVIGHSTSSIKCLMRLRHQQPLVPCSIYRR